VKKRASCGKDDGKNSVLMKHKPVNHRSSGYLVLNQYFYPASILFNGFKQERTSPRREHYQQQYVMSESANRIFSQTRKHFISLKKDETAHHTWIISEGHSSNF